MISRIRRSLYDLRRSERGIALPMALMVTVVGMGLAAVPIVASVNSQGGNQHNQGANEALAAAEAGAEWALREQGTLHREKGDNRLCWSTATVTTGWCPQEPRPENASQAVPVSIGLATYMYDVLPCYGTGAATSVCTAVASSIGCTEAPVEIVSTGTALVGGLPVRRRVEITGCAGSFNMSEYENERESKRAGLTALQEKLRELEEPGKTLETELIQKTSERTKLEETIAKEKAEGKTRFESKTGTKTEPVEREVPPPVFSGGQVAGIEGLTMSNGAYVYNGGVGSNSFVKMSGNANVCGTVRYVTEYTATNGSNTPPANCASGRTFLKTSKYTYPEVLLPTNIATQNSDGRLTGADPASGYERRNILWNESKKELNLTYGELKLEGTLPYYLCRLVLGGNLVSGAGKTIRIFFENPNKCPSLNGASQMVMSNGTEVQPDSGHGPGFYFVGAAATEKEQSKIELAGGSKSTQLVVYGPRSKITASNGINMSGTVIGKTLELAGGVRINEKGAFTPPTTTEFVAAEKVKEEVQVPTSESVETTLGHNEDTLGTIKTAIEAIAKKIEAINKAPIEGLEKKLGEEVANVSAWEKLKTSGSGAAGYGSFKKSSFNECSATPPSSGNPASGC